MNEDPALLFHPEGRKIIIDEVQKLPDLLSYVQIHADKQKINGGEEDFNFKGFNVRSWRNLDVIGE